MCEAEVTISSSYFIELLDKYYKKLEYRKDKARKDATEYTINLIENRSWYEFWIPKSSDFETVYWFIEKQLHDYHGGLHKVDRVYSVVFWADDEFKDCEYWVNTMKSLAYCADSITVSYKTMWKLMKVLDEDDIHG
jgi:hypothetical protein